MNAVLLMQKIAASGLSVALVSEKIGLSRQGLYYKLSGDREFKASEIRALKKLLALTPEELCEMFFEEDVVYAGRCTELG